jgi:hypothetical protein
VTAVPSGRLAESTWGSETMSMDMQQPPKRDEIWR